MEGIVDLHHDIMSILIIIFVSVAYTMIYFLWNFSEYRSTHLYNITHNTFWEIIWTSVPVFILILILIPSYALLYGMEGFSWNPQVLVKAVGHQWYWSYEVSCFDLLNVEFDSCMIPEDDLGEGDLRLLEVDEQVFLPVDTQIGFITTSDDVIHSWSVPSFGIKLDAIPGRFNYIQTYIMREGTFYGQCSELCGLAHSFMPISVLCTEDYYFYVTMLDRE